MTREDEDGFLIPAPIQTDMFAVDGGFTMPWVRWFQQFRRKLRVPAIVVGRTKLPGVQVVGTDLLDSPCVVRLEDDIAARLYEAQGRCFTAPATSDYEAIITYRRPPATTFTSIFRPGESLIIPVGETEAIPVEPLVTDFYEGDDFNVDVIAADGTVADVELTLRGVYRLR